MELTYTQSSKQEPLTLETIKEAIEIFERPPLAPFVFYSQCVERNQVLHGKGIDKIAEQTCPKFDPKKHKGFMVSEHWREGIKELLLHKEKGRVFKWKELYQHQWKRNISLNGYVI